YDSWGEIRHDLESLRANGFPFDGVALDLQWFGGRFNEPNAEPRMGTLRFNEREDAFPRPARSIADLRRDYGVHLMPIEESYVDRRLPEFTQMKCFLASLLVGACQPVGLTRDINREEDRFVWWGKGGMIDWSNPAGARWWHDTKRLPLSRMGIYH